MAKFNRQQFERDVSAFIAEPYTEDDLEAWFVKYRGINNQASLVESDNPEEPGSYRTPSYAKLAAYLADNKMPSMAVGTLFDIIQFDEREDIRQKSFSIIEKMARGQDIKNSGKEIEDIEGYLLDAAMLRIEQALETEGAADKLPHLCAIVRAISLKDSVVFADVRSCFDKVRTQFPEDQPEDIQSMLDENQQWVKLSHTENPNNSLEAIMIHFQSLLDGDDSGVKHTINSAHAAAMGRNETFATRTHHLPHLSDVIRDTFKVR